MKIWPIFCTIFFQTVSPTVDDHTLGSKTKRKEGETLKSRLDKRQRTDKIRFYFRLPASELLDGKTDCVLHAAFERNRAEAGTLYVFKNFLCFKSSLPNSLSLVVPLRFDAVFLGGRIFCTGKGPGVKCFSDHNF